MCTLTFIAVDGGAGNPPGLRVVMNRDELRAREEALAPQWRELAGGEGGEGGMRAIWPTDPVGGGTWIAANSAGMVLCLLNLNLEPKPELPAGLISRGQIIPRFVQAESGGQLLEALRGADLSRFAPFRLVVAPRATDHEVVVWECRWDREQLEVIKHERLPVCFVSSGLGDRVVQPRVELFKQRLAVVPTPEMQDRFHGHQWPGQGDVSVMMGREDARTVSVTTVEVGGAAGAPEVRMVYRPIPEWVGGGGRGVRDEEDAGPLAVISRTMVTHPGCV
jgi:hypothetical protein